MTPQPDSAALPQSRRAFLRRLGAGTLGFAALALMQACGGTSPTPTVASSGAGPSPTTGSATTSSSASASSSATTTGRATSGGSATTSGSAATTSSSVSSSSAATSAAGKPGGRLRIIQLNDVAPREPHLTLGANAVVQMSVWDTLTRYDEKIQPQPLLAESWSWSADYRTLTLKLRQGVKYHSGREFTAEDVEFNITRVRDPAVGSQMRGASTEITKIDRPDPYTVVLSFDAPFLAVFDMFDTLVMLDKETVPQLSQGKVIGTGPFTWKSWTPNTKVVLEKNPNYWQQGTPLLDAIELTIAGDVQALGVQLEAGQQDVAVGVPSQDFVRLREDKKYNAVSLDTAGGFFYLAANVKVPPLDKKEVRLAIHYALDRQRALRTALSNVGVTALLPWPEGSPAYDAALNQSITFDLDKAKSLLTQAGLGSGFEIPITYNTQRTATVGKMIEIFQPDLAKIGVKLNIQTQENTVFQKTLNDASFPGLFSHGHGGSSLTPVTLFVQAFPFRKQNASNFTSPDYTRLVDAMQVEGDAAKLKELYTSMNHLLLDEAFNLEIASNPVLYVTGAKVRDIGYAASGWYLFPRTSFA
jgi:peptide/nickel transport system substrate-binding protein